MICEPRARLFRHSLSSDRALLSYSLFQSPDLYTDMKNNRCVTTLFLTAGDSGTTGLTYIKSREAGNEAATAAMAGVADQYTEFYAKFGGQSVLVRTLVG